MRTCAQRLQQCLLLSGAAQLLLVLLPPALDGRICLSSPPNPPASRLPHAAAAANPLLHAAKICNQLSLGPLKIGGFLVFAAVFFVSRVLLVPWAVIKPALLDSRCAAEGGP